jgi:hypothetical protein
VNGGVSGSYPVTDFGISEVVPSGFTVRELYIKC